MYFYLVILPDVYNPKILCFTRDYYYARRVVKKCILNNINYFFRKISFRDLYEYSEFTR